MNNVPNDETIAAYLEKYGFKKSVAGEETKVGPPLTVAANLGIIHNNTNLS